MNWIHAQLMAVVIPLGLLAALGAALKALPGLLEAKASAALDKLFAQGDKADDAWIVATIQWAEAKYGAGSGKQKAAACVDKLMGLVPLQYRLFITPAVKDKAVALFQASFDRLEAVALKEAQEHGPDAPVAAPAAIPPAQDNPPSAPKA